ncbi:anti-anti-sigma regulatory factor [Methylophaga lonarensis MPL]|uniref:Anti-anti-sigma regulatory factor n=1 Tax=Methylophaga lonarensis MPL TaxID=1286106 RepID=M7P461_9GAMM|nr:STAS domain-containing protein [Methylophaga lonarensis]EMR14276.1 anti-anti-sigma regulatory factor [Methylophaga lonarensis MPL]
MTDSSLSTIELGDKLTVAEVTDCYLRMLEVLLAGEAVSINSANLQRVDAAGAQLVFAFAQACAQQQLPIDWQEPSQALKESLELLGLAEKINIQQQHI